MNKLNLALISGGMSSEREVSIKGADQVYEALDKEKYRVFRFDPRHDLPRLAADYTSIDAALIILHGPYGEDGTMQGMLDLLGIPYQGTGVLGSAVAMNKIATKKLYEKSGIPGPAYLILDRDKDSTIGFDELKSRIGLPFVVKPVSAGSSIGLSLVKEESALQQALDLAFEQDREVMVEEYIKGVEITVGVLGNDDLEALPVIEIVPTGSSEFFDYDAKYTPGTTEEICPARIDDAIKEKTWIIAKNAHKALFCRGYSRTDMIIRDGDIYVLETNTIPGMTETSLLPLAAKTAGISFSALLDRLIELSLQDKNKG